MIPNTYDLANLLEEASVSASETTVQATADTSGKKLNNVSDLHGQKLVQVDTTEGELFEYALLCLQSGLL